MRCVGQVYYNCQVLILTKKYQVDIFIECTYPRSYFSYLRCRVTINPISVSESHLVFQNKNFRNLISGRKMTGWNPVKWWDVTVAWQYLPYGQQQQKIVARVEWIDVDKLLNERILAGTCARSGTTNLNCMQSSNIYTSDGVFRLLNHLLTEVHQNFI